jgi:hypothetical protein
MSNDFGWRLLMPLQVLVIARFFFRPVKTVAVSNVIKQNNFRTPATKVWRKSHTQ